MSPFVDDVHIWKGRLLNKDWMKPLRFELALYPESGRGDARLHLTRLELRWAIIIPVDIVLAPGHMSIEQPEDRTLEHHSHFQHSSHLAPDRTENRR